MASTRAFLARRHQRAFQLLPCVSAEIRALPLAPSHVLCIISTRLIRAHIPSTNPLARVQGLPHVGPARQRASPSLSPRATAVLCSDHCQLRPPNPTVTYGGSFLSSDQALTRVPVGAESEFLPQKSEQITRFLPQN